MNRKYLMSALSGAIAVAGLLQPPAAHACPLSQRPRPQQAPAVPNPYLPVSSHVVVQQPVTPVATATSQSVKIVATAPVVETPVVAVEPKTALPAFSVNEALARR